MLWVIDGATPLDGGGSARSPRASRASRVLVALNKCDRAAVVAVDDVAALLDGAPRRIVRVSAVRGDGLEALREALGVAAGGAGIGRGLGGRGGREPATCGGARPRAARARSARPTPRATGAPGEIVAIELRDALAAIGEVTGKAIAEDLLERIFGKFCVGK